MRSIAPAKINLHLRVGPPTSTGFHPLVSWMCTIGLCDTLVVSPAPQTVLTCDDSTLACDEENLILRAVRALEREARLTGFDLPTVKIALEKIIPLGGGLGGGSSDAATTLMILNETFKHPLSPNVLHRMAAELGSDVPFFLHGPSAICMGRGEIVQPTATPRPKAALLILPGIAMPTPAVYRKFDELRLGEDSDWATEPAWTKWAIFSAEALLPLLVNDLEPAAFAIEPTLKTLRADLEQTLHRPVRMSGSGSSLFTLFDEIDDAKRAADQLRSRIDSRAIRLAPQKSSV